MRTSGEALSTHVEIARGQLAASKIEDLDSDKLRGQSVRPRASRDSRHEMIVAPMQREADPVVDPRSA
jgi:hypothetical protein